MSEIEAREAETGTGTGTETGTGTGTETETETETGTGTETETEIETETETETGTETETASATGTKAEKPARKPLKEKLEHLIAEYGTVAFIIYFSISLFTYVGFFLAIKAGIDVDTSSAGKSAGTMMAAWVPYKLTMPVRIIAALVLTPIIGRFVHRWRHPNE